MNKPKILAFDIETAPFKCWTFRIGSKVSLSHNAIVKEKNKNPLSDVICIAYSWLHEKKIHIMDWDYEKQDSSLMLEKMAELVEEADIVLTQNGDRFDIRHINTQLMVNGCPPLKGWEKFSDDMLKQLRKFFYLPSYRQDYVAKLLLDDGGKDPVTFQDWINIVEKNTDGEKSFKKMLKYCKKDVKDLKAIWKRIEPYVESKYNYNTVSLMPNQIGQNICIKCGSTDIIKNGTRVSGATKYQRFHCRTHGGPAGKAVITSTGKLGKLGN